MKILLPNLLPKAGRRGDSRGRRTSRFQQLTDFYLRLRGFESHPLRHLIFESFLRLESLGTFPTAKFRGFEGRITICVTRFDTAFAAEIAVRESNNAARAEGFFLRNLMTSSSHCGNRLSVLDSRSASVNPACRGAVPFHRTRGEFRRRTPIAASDQAQTPLSGCRPRPMTDRECVRRPRRLLRNWHRIPLPTMPRRQRPRIKA